MVGKLDKQHHVMHSHVIIREHHGRYRVAGVSQVSFSLQEPAHSTATACRERKLLQALQGRAFTCMKVHKQRVVRCNGA